MKFIQNNWYWLLIILVLSSMLLVKCENEKSTKHDTPKYTTVSTKKEALEILPVPETIVKKFHEIKTITKIEQKIKFDTIKIAFKDTVPCIFERSGELKREYYTLGYKVNNKALEVTKLDLVPDTLTIVDGSKRKWFWGKETNAVDVSHSNKLFYNSDVQHVVVKKEKRFYETTLFKLGVGFAAGVAIKK